MTSASPPPRICLIPPLRFETERLILRALTKDDADVVFATYSGDPVATRYMSYPRALSASDCQPFLDGVDRAFRGDPDAPQTFGWIIQEKGSGAYIGSCGIGVAHSAKDPSTWSGGYILNPAFWGHGYATEAWRSLVEWVKAQPSIMTLYAYHHPDNRGSGKVMQKAGMTCIGLMPAYTVLPNVGAAPVDVIRYEWQRK